MKKNLLLIHGWLGNKKYWTEKILKNLKKDFQIKAVTLTGFHENDDDPNMTISDYSDEIIEIIKNSEKKFDCILGHSIGGAFCLKAISKNKIPKEKIPENLILYSAKLIPTKNKWTKISKILLPFKKIFPEKIRKKIAGFIVNQAESDYHESKHLEKTYKNILKVNLRKEAKNLHLNFPDLKVLIIGGENDKQPWPSDLELFHNFIKNSKLKIFKNVSHFMHLEKPELFCFTIRDFLK